MAAVLHLHAQHRAPVGGTVPKFTAIGVTASSQGAWRSAVPWKSSCTVPALNALVVSASAPVAVALARGLVEDLEVDLLAGRQRVRQRQRRGG